MKGKSAVAKGKILEKYVADQIREKGIDPKAYPAHGSGNTNREKADIWTSMIILGQNAGIECKNQKVIKITEWWPQTRKLESLGREPVLVFKIHHAPLGDTLATVYLDTLLELIKNQGTSKEEIINEIRDKAKTFAMYEDGKYKYTCMAVELKDIHGR